MDRLSERAGLRPFDELVTDLSVLVLDTFRVWWRLLPQLLALYVMGWLGSQLALRLAVFAGDISAWLALVLYAFNFVSLLIAVVLILRLVGRELGIGRLVGAEEAARDGRDESISRLLAVTLLPFLGIYAAFGQATAAANELVVEQLVRYGVVSTGDTVLGVLNRAATDHPGRLLLIVAAVYALRRVLDLVHERTGRQVVGLAVAFVESFFVLLVLLGGIRLLQRVLLWVEDRAVWGWVAAVRDAAATVLARFAIDLPAVLDAFAGVVVEQVWPALWEVLTQPVIWLAVAALVYGSQVVSLAEVWRHGRTVAARVPGVRTLGRRRVPRTGPRVGPVPRGFSRVAGEARDLLLGDVNDKYLPTYHSLRLVLRAGLVFLGAYVLVYSLLLMVSSYAGGALYAVIGGHETDFWSAAQPALDLALALPFEPLRLCLLAVAFRRCLELFQQRAATAGRTAAA